MDQGHNDAPAVMRRKRRAIRQLREKTPEPSRTVEKPQSDEESSSTDQRNVQNVRMQIKPPGTISAHKSKILNRRNKVFAGAAARSLSSPREDKDAGPEINDLLRSARRSLSSPRHKDESSESGRSSPHLSNMTAPRIPPRTQFPETVRVADVCNLSRLEQNLRKFEEEQRKFELEKKKFEREKRGLHRIRNKQIDIPEDLKRLLANYGKINSPIRSDTSTKLTRNIGDSHSRNTSPGPVKKTIDLPARRFSEYESSTLSSSDSEAIQADVDDEDIIAKVKSERRSVSRHSSSPTPKKTIQAAPQQEQQSSPRDTLELVTDPVTKKSVLSKLWSVFKKPKAEKTEESPEKKKSDLSAEGEIFTRAFLKLMWKEFRTEWIRMKSDHSDKVLKMKLLWNKCFSHIILLSLLVGFGGLMFRFVEGNFENVYKCHVRKVKRDFLDQLWTTSFSMREDDWKSNARTKLRTFEEELQTAYEAGLVSYSGKNSWNFVNSVLFCLSVVTSIGYGHIAPKTTLGRFLTIIYAIIGIPIFLILLADFGKLFTRGIKFIWAYVRRLYYTGTCRKVRKQQQVREVMRGINAVYDVAMRRPSQYVSPDIEVGRSPTDPGGVHSVREPDTPQSVSTHFATASNMGTPTTPYPETFEIDDEFNLPISLAIVILLLYIFFGAIIYVLWEDWSYFESFYFVFISMSTIGFGDFVPNHPIFMMCSIIYLVFGLALTSMCINVVQAKLHDSFAQASAKIGATIGLTLAEEESKRSLNVTPPNELASVHSAAKLEHILESDGEGSPEHLSTNEQQNRNLLTTHNNTNEDDAPPPLLPKKTQIVDKSEKKKKKFFNF